MKELVRKFILQRAGDVFRAKGFTKATIDEIARAADLSKPTLYNYFPSKRELFMAVLEDLHAKIAEMVQPFALDSDTPFPQRLANMNEQISRYFFNHQGLIRILMFEQGFISDGVSHKEMKYLKQNFTRGVIFQTILRFFINARERGEVDSAYDPDLLTMLYVGMTSQINLNQVMNGWDEENYMARANHIAHIFCHGILRRHPEDSRESKAIAGEKRRIK